MEEKVFSLSKNSEVITATYQTRYDPCDGIIQVQIPCTSPKMELDIVNLDMEQVMGSVMGSSVLVSACYLQRVDTTKGGDIDWQRGLEELRQMGPSCSKEETVSVETPVVGAMKSGIQDNSQDSKRLEPIVDKCRDSIGYEAIEDKCTDRESEQQNKQHLVSSVYKYEKETYADNVTTSLFVTGAGKQVKAKQVSNEWAKSFLSDIVVEAPYQRNTSTVANSANMSMEEKLQVKSNTPNDESMLKCSIFCCH